MVQTDLSERFQKYKDAPLVSVRVLRYRSQKFLVLGGVEKPGAFAVDGSTTLLEGVAHAEGIRDGADVERAYVVRRSALVPVNLGDLLLRGETGKNIVMRDGDVVFVPPEIRQEVYVLGEVRQPGRIAISPSAPGGSARPSASITATVWPGTALPMAPGFKTPRVAEAPST